MIGAIGTSSYSSYTSTSSTSSTQAQRFQEALLSKLDTDEDGSISKAELGSALNSDSKDGITVSLSQAFSTLDSDEDDSLDAEELAALTPPPPPPPATDLADELLSALDTDGDGSISSDELSVGLTGAGSSADSRQVFSALDTNEDGTVSLEELTASLQPKEPPAQTADLSESDSNPIAAQALSKMIAALGERYDTEGNRPVGRHLDTAA
ncbi:EF-hand domain-containing protein [Pseudomonas ovata]|uniref:EF-hand domain-containing protein n=1 Tax=Pseudomonas ovata TaxID=1839709 RepID=UPI000D68D9B6|nr:EF-hand domain-containing protein [Pseudomonas ovata]